MSFGNWYHGKIEDFEERSPMHDFDKRFFTGKKIDDNSGITMKVTANTKLFLYKGEISLDPAS